MGDVDFLDQAANNYRVLIHGKKSGRPSFTQILNGAIINACKIHQVNAEEPVDLLMFPQNVTRHYLRLGTKNQNHRRPAFIVSDIVLEKGGHFNQTGEATTLPVLSQEVHVGMREVQCYILFEPRLLQSV
ncbi:hypothetical protein HPB48_003339 [Haemaphysalis longicornis]|uniref:Uncharacterized protein n=1 Tax=Haemaphysalis longicornis TaxID=44386 RepID=A0A9J6GKC6_HAELO|nr:hypothetical protein HPB48_003339 [Haemaphysalis longicornis]